MNIARCGVLLLAATSILPAGVIDLSSSQTVTIRSDEILSFELFTSNYRSASQQLGLPAQPNVLQFVLATLPISGSELLVATLRVPGASITVPLENPLYVASGQLSSAGFQGAVSTFQGQFQLDALTDLLTGPLWLDFTSFGDDFTLGLAPLPLNRNLFVSLSGGALSVGAVSGSVLLQRPASAAIDPAAAPVPEPNSLWMLSAGVLGLALGYAVQGGFHTSR